MIEIIVPRALIDAPSAPSRGAGGWLCHYARRKPGADSALTAILRMCHLTRSERILDLGCVSVGAGTPFANALLIAGPR
jgi:hypothetical protein